MTAHDILKSAISLALTATAAFGASWEDPAPVRVRNQTPSQYGQQSRTTPTRRPQPAPEPVQYADASDDDLYSQHLDADVRDIYAYGATYVSETQFGPYGATDIVDADIEFRMFEFNGFLWGAFDAWINAHGMYFLENPDMEALPDALIDAGIDIGQTWRFVTGWSTEIRAAPGIYSDVTSPAFAIPLTLNFYYAFHPQLSLQLGGTFRSGWDIPVMPNVGLAWQPADIFRLEAGVPKSTVTLFPRHILSVFGTYEWRNVTYALDDEEPGRPEDMTLDDMFVTAGVALCPMGDYSLTAEVGKFIQRELSADVAENNAIDLSKEQFIRIMIKGGF
jgi:hypothetical protein